ncbi:MAG: DUF928 domain-containing protein [Oscillatoria sp. SIO1A7]|nr:DUF928 domain-containing protein [Oscillatoria sp. SIO1A7]
MSWEKSLEWGKFYRARKLAALVLSPAMVMLASLSIPQAAKSLEFNTSGLEIGQPDSSVGGGVRGLYCSVPGDALKGLVPGQNQDIVGKTVSKTPTLYWYIPEIKKEDEESPVAAKTGELLVLDEEGNQVYFAEFPLPASPAIIKHEIPASAGLEEGKKYKWLMAIVCNPDDLSSNEAVVGELRVVGEEPTLENALASAKTALEQAEAYAQAQIWHDTVDSLAKERNKYKEEWEQLLASVGLPIEIARAEVIDCCEVEE